MTVFHKLIAFSTLLASLVFYSGCGSPQEKENQFSPEEKEAMQAVTLNYANIVHANYQDARMSAEHLRKALQKFVETPNEQTHNAAKMAWKAAREPYGQTEAFRFSNGPIDSRGGPEALLNAWPLDEALIDYVRPGTGGASNYQGVNIINNLDDFPELTREVLLEMHEHEGNEANVTVGFHAVEFLLWGQDFIDPSNGKPGQRPFTDYVTKARGSHENQKRRGEYLLICADLLVQHLTEMENEWNPQKEGNYRQTFLNLKPKEALRNMMSGIGILSKAELAGERMVTPVANGQEDEHSCFSDNTHRDIVNNAQGIRNVLTGEYLRLDGTRISGTALIDLIDSENEELAEELISLSEQTMSKTQEIPFPFDIAISKESLENPGPVMEAVEVLQKQGDKLSQAASELGLTISTALPE